MNGGVGAGGRGRGRGGLVFNETAALSEDPSPAILRLPQHLGSLSENGEERDGSRVASGESPAFQVAIDSPSEDSVACAEDRADSPARPSQRQPDQGQHGSPEPVAPHFLDPMALRRSAWSAAPSA